MHFRETQGVKSSEGEDAFALNFFNIDFGVEVHVYVKTKPDFGGIEKSVKIAGKKVKDEWLTSIFPYLRQRRLELGTF